MHIPIGTNCAILYGRNQRCGRQHIIDSLEKVGLKTRVRQPSATAALEYACQTNAARWCRDNDAVAVRALADRAGFEVSGITRGSITNTMTHLFSVGTSANGDICLLKYSLTECDEGYLRSCLQDSYEYGRGLLSPTQVGTVVKSVVRQLNGTSLDGKCTYFLLGTGIPKWGVFADESGLSRAYTMAHLAIAQNQEVLNYLFDNLGDRASKEAAEIEEAILMGGLTPQQAKRLAKRAAALSATLGEYEFGIGLHLGHFRQRLEQVRKQAAVAGLLSASV